MRPVVCQNDKLKNEGSHSRIKPQYQTVEEGIGQQGLDSASGDPAAQPPDRCASAEPVWWQIKHYDTLAPLARILVMGQLDAHQQRELAHNVQPVALTAVLLAVKMQAVPCICRHHQAPDACQSDRGQVRECHCCKRCIKNVSAGLNCDALLLHLSLRLLLSPVDEVDKVCSRHPPANISQALWVLDGSWELVCHLQLHAKVCITGWHADSAA